MRKFVLAALLGLIAPVAFTAPAFAQNTYGGNNCRNGNDCNRQGERRDPNYGYRGEYTGYGYGGYGDTFTDGDVVAWMIAMNQTRDGKLKKITDPEHTFAYSKACGWKPVLVGCSNASASGTQTNITIPASATKMTFVGGVTWRWSETGTEFFVSIYDDGKINSVSRALR